jgi:hypothetical protein
MMRKLLTLFAAVALFAGCAGAYSGGATPFGDLAQVTTADITAALADATAHQDKAAMQCYPVLLEVIASLPSALPAVSEPKGVVSLYQAARDISKAVQAQGGPGQSAIAQKINLGCAALFNDTQGDILRLGLKFRP